MLSHIYLCMILATVIYVNGKPALSADIEPQNPKYTDEAMMERLIDHPYDDIYEEENFHDKRQLNKKWAKFYQGAQSPYTIAFPALIRTRRWIE